MTGKQQNRETATCVNLEANGMSNPISTQTISRLKGTF